MNHDIIDHRKEKLVDHINRILSSTASARFIQRGQTMVLGIFIRF
jgi:hypothetical protein